MMSESVIRPGEDLVEVARPPRAVPIPACSNGVVRRLGHRQHRAGPPRRTCNRREDLVADPECVLHVLRTVGCGLAGQHVARNAQEIRHPQQTRVGIAATDSRLHCGEGWPSVGTSGAGAGRRPEARRAVSRRTGRPRPCGQLNLDNASGHPAPLLADRQRKAFAQRLARNCLPLRGLRAALQRGSCGPKLRRIRLRQSRRDLLCNAQDVVEQIPEASQAHGRSDSRTACNSARARTRLGGRPVARRCAVARARRRACSS